MSDKPKNAEDALAEMEKELSSKGPKKARAALIKREVKHFDSADHEKNKHVLGESKAEK